jgi:hypothetical protein
VVPPYVRYAGQAVNRAGDTVEAEFRIYAAPRGGEPLWSETQRVTVGEDGKYSILLGGSTEGGIPPGVFAGGEGRWLGVSIERAPEQARTALVSVAYAMKAGDADTVGGLAAGDLVTQAELAATARQTSSPGLLPVGPDAVPPPSGSGNINMVALWSGPNTLGNSIIHQGGTVPAPTLGINTTQAHATVDVNGTGNFRNNLQLNTGVASTAASGVNSPMQLFQASSFLANQSEPIEQVFGWQAIAENNNTSAPTANLNLVYGMLGQTPTPTGLQIYPDGIIQFAPNQNYPGTITSVEPGIGLTGGGSSGNVLLTVDTGAVPLMSNANTFTAAQSFSSGLTEKGTSSFTGSTSFSGPGNGLAGTSTGSSYSPGGSTGAGVMGYGPAGVAGNGKSIGVYGSQSSSYGSGVFGAASGTGSTGVYGTATGPSSNGLSGYAPGTGGVGVNAIGSSYGGQVTATGGNGIGLAVTANGAAGVGITTSGGLTGLISSGQAYGLKAAVTGKVGAGIYTVGRKPGLLMPGSFTLDYPEGYFGLWADEGGPPNSTDYVTAMMASSDNNTAIAGFSAGQTATLWLHNINVGGDTNYQAVPVLHASGRKGDCVMNSNGDNICSGVHATSVPAAGGERQVEMYAVHAAENWFEDFGSGQLEHGAAVVQIDPAFAGTVNGQMDYHVFLTPRGDCEGLYVTNETPTSFEVHELRGGKTNVAFDYRITARRAGHETERMADVTEEMRRDPRFDHAIQAARQADVKPEE